MRGRHDEDLRSRKKVACVVVKRPLQGLGVNKTSAFAVMGLDDEREKEIAANLDRVGEDISALLSMAKDIGTEVDVQNEQIITIAEEVRSQRFHHEVEHQNLTQLMCHFLPNCQWHQQMFHSPKCPSRARRWTEGFATPIGRRQTSS